MKPSDYVDDDETIGKKNFGQFDYSMKCRSMMDKSKYSVDIRNYKYGKR